MAQGLQLGLGVPLWAGYAVSTVIIFPLVIYGMKLLSKLQTWTNPLWLVMIVLPLVILIQLGFLVGFGTRYAGGCTSGHAISGLANLQWVSLVAVVGFFVGGLVMTWFIYPLLFS